MYIPALSAEALRSVLDEHPVPADHSLVLYVAEDDLGRIEDCMQVLLDADVSFMGGLFPGVISDSRALRSGAVVQILPSVGRPIVTPGLSEGGQFDPAAFQGVRESNEAKSILVLVDGLTSGVEGFLQSLYQVASDRYTYIGAGAGPRSLVPGPCLFCNDGVFYDAAVVLPLQYQTSIGVQHGWRRVVGPLVATRTAGNVVLELNWETAYDVYRRVVLNDSGVEPQRDNLYDVSKGYPFGMYRDEAEDVARGPVAVTREGGLVCLGEVPVNSVLHILSGDHESLVEAAGSAARGAVSSCHPSSGLVVDCISRLEFLNSRFDGELEAIGSPFLGSGCPAPEGILSLGEISSIGGGYLEFYNNTVVAGSFSQVR